MAHKKIETLTQASDCNSNNDSTDNNHNNDYIIIKKYANRRLYNMAQSQYITLDNLADIIRSGMNFVVYDAKTGEDITRSILTQIIAEQESKGNHLLPMSFLLDMVKIYGNNVHGLVPDYWNQSMRIFKENREKLQKGLDTALVSVAFPLEQLRKVADSNSQIFSKTVDMLNMFNPSKKKSNQVTLSKQEHDSLLQKIERLEKVEADFNKIKKAARENIKNNKK
jgi:polyhydroxyalkanoate synthesis repressor PhaR